MKKLVALLLAVLMVVALFAGCAPKAEDTADPPAEDKTANDDPVEDKPSDEPADEDVFKIGLHTALTGSFGSNFPLYGVLTGVELINEAGGIQGKKVEVVYYDDTSTPEGAVKAATRLIEVDGVNVIIGNHSSPSAVAVAPICEEAGVLYISGGNSSSWTNCGYNYVFRSNVNVKYLSATIAEKVAELGFKNTGVISVESDYGQSARDEVMGFLAEKNIEVVSNVSYQATETDFTGQVTKLIANDPECIVINGDGPAIALLLSRLRQMGYNKVVFTAEGGGNPQVLEIGGAAADGLVFAAPYLTPASIEGCFTDREVAFCEKYEEVNGEFVGHEIAYRAYDGFMLACAALNKSADPYDKDANLEAFRSLTGIELLAGDYDFTDASGDGLFESNCYMVQDVTVKLYDADTMKEWMSNQ